MKLITVIEDTLGDSGCVCEHGLCIYIETKKHRILMDTGATLAFAENAARLHIDLRQIDTVVISHGHYDHTGGLLKFAEINPDADIYMQETAVGDFFHGERYIGMDKQILNLPGLHLIKGDCRIDEELYLFSGVTGRRFWPKSNLALSKRENHRMVQDDFYHEQCLVVAEGRKHILLSGCAHNGILNILDRYQSIYQSVPDMVVSGFHMMKKSEYDREEIRVIEETAKELKKLDTIFYTGHCTGTRAFDIMHEIMGEKLVQMHSGENLSE